MEKVMKVIRYSTLGFSLISLNGCGLLPTVYYDSSNSAYEVAKHNYETLLASSENSRILLLVDKDGHASPKDIFLYINGLREPLQKYSIMSQTLIQYNKDVMDELRKNKG